MTFKNLFFSRKKILFFVKNPPHDFWNKKMETPTFEEQMREIFGEKMTLSDLATTYQAQVIRGIDSWADMHASVFRYVGAAEVPFFTQAYIPESTECVYWQIDTMLPIPSPPRISIKVLCCHDLEEAKVVTFHRRSESDCRDKVHVITIEADSEFDGRDKWTKKLILFKSGHVRAEEIDSIDHRWVNRQFYSRWRQLLGQK